MFHLSINSKRWVSAARLDDRLLEVFYLRVIRPRGQVMLKFFNRLRRPLGQGLDTAIVKISDIASDLMTCRRTLCEIPESDPLNFPADHKSPGNGHGNQFRISDSKFQVSDGNLVKPGIQIL